MNPDKVRVSDEEIVVYKVLGCENGGYFSPIYMTPWTIGEVLSTDVEKPVLKEHKDNNFTAISLNGNAFHSFSNINDAKKYIDICLERRTHQFEKYVIAECAIPVNSNFIYLGAYNKTGDCYASEKLVVDKILD